MLLVLLLNKEDQITKVPSLLKMLKEGKTRAFLETQWKSSFLPKSLKPMMKIAVAASIAARRQTATKWVLRSSIAVHFKKNLKKI